MEGFGIEKLSLVLVIVLVLFGARRIPEIGGSIGKGIREFKRGMSDLHDAPAESTRNDDLHRGATEPANAAEGEPKRLLGP